MLIMMRYPSKLLTFCFVLAATLCVASQTFCYREFRRAQHEQDMMSARRSIGRLYRRLSEAQDGQRGYLLTGNPDYLLPYTRAMDRMGELWSDVEAQPAGHIPLDLPQLKEKIDRVTGAMKETIRLYNTKGRGAALEEVIDGGGEQTMEELRQELQAYLDKDLVGILYVQRSAHDVFDYQILTGIMGFCVLLIIYSRLLIVYGRAHRAELNLQEMGRVVEEVAASSSPLKVRAESR